jgi:EAL domain-containing protein (putative c-di-GMP-specific phosphodiesterase class I)
MPWEQRISHALEKKEGYALRFFHQPIISIDASVDAEATFFEALVRLEQPNGIIATAGEFIDSLQDAKLLMELDKWMLCNAAKQIAASGHEYAVNLSPASLRSPHLLRDLGTILFDRSALARLLHLEISEKGIIARQEQDNMRSLIDAYSLWLDDVGSTNSKHSVSHLADLPLTGIKIDGSLISKISTHAKNRKVVGGLMSIARDLGLFCIAEGVENQGCWDCLKTIRDKYAPKLKLFVQGWAIGHPVEVCPTPKSKIATVTTLKSPGVTEYWCGDRRIAVYDDGDRFKVHENGEIEQSNDGLDKLMLWLTE